MRVKLLKRVENIMTKGEIARFEQFFLLPECFQRLPAADESESFYKWERVKKENKNQKLSNTYLTLSNINKIAVDDFKNIW